MYESLFQLFHIHLTINIDSVKDNGVESWQLCSWYLSRLLINHSLSWERMAQETFFILSKRSINDSEDNEGTTKKFQRNHGEFCFRKLLTSSNDFALNYRWSLRVIYKNLSATIISDSITRYLIIIIIVSFDRKNGKFSNHFSSSMIHQIRFCLDWGRHTQKDLSFTSH